MGPKSKIRSDLETIMEAPSMKDCRDVAEVENNREKWGNSYEDFAFELEASLGRISGDENPRCGGDVNFVNVSHLGCNDLREDQFQETAESSSSFDDDVSGPESGSAFSDEESVLDFQDDAMCGRVGEEFRMRNKRLTDHWRTYIQPVMWRCKWVELQIRKLNKLEHKFTRDLAKGNQNELQQVENCAPDRRSSELPFTGDQRLDIVLTRKRRKRIEDTVDTATYMSEHNLFSYYENKKVPANGFSSYEKSGNIEFNSNDEFTLDEDLLLKSRDNDESSEQVFQKLWALMDQVNKLKIRLDKVMSDIAGEFTHADPKSSLVPCNALNTSVKCPTSPINGDIMALGSSHNVSQLLSGFNMGEFEDDILIYNDRMYDGMNGFENFNVQPAKKPPVVSKEYRRTAEPPAMEDTEMLTAEQPAAKVRSIAQITTSGSRKSQRGRVPRRF